MRLGDLDELKNAINTFYDEHFKGLVPNELITYAQAVDDLIDNAPTVEPCYQTTSCLDCKNYDKENYYCPRFCEVIREIAKENQRPQGEWVKTGQSFVNPNKFRNFCCSNCLWELDEHIRIAPNFCPNCGAEMRGREE